ncbi:hypothetical protein PoB_004554200 [Plakobranchus ocellatus]|uniref:Uncharacterized protein n=1 Tax=Plakobranchus ocellatus TaxID=259542 RepID=A0AAV4BJD2_9GAST|nr:hypothetical protein PoB_004554200 [Plakobranchus ocellatus]
MVSDAILNSTEMFCQGFDSTTGTRLGEDKKLKITKLWTATNNRLSETCVYFLTIIMNRCVVKRSPAFVRRRFGSGFELEIAAEGSQRISGSLAIVPPAPLCNSSHILHHRYPFLPLSF